MSAKVLGPGNNKGVAIVGMGVRAPGQINDPDTFWSSVVQGHDLIGELPAERREVFPGEWEGMVTRGGYLSGAFDFDAKFFGISPREARVIDPQQRLLLEVVWEAFEDAAIQPSAVGSSTGVFVGITGQDYRHWFVEEPSTHWTAGNGHSFAAGRISHVLGLQGPALAIDTACSSSLVAIHTACQSLALGECDVAVAAGVNLILAPWTTLALSKTGALSPEGRSHPFDRRANGFVRGEGCAAVTLKRVADARRDGDRILAVIDGSAVNHDGRSSTFAAPNVNAQAKLITSLLNSLGLSPNEIGYHEAHGTSTQLGDTAEMAAITAALGAADDDRRLYVGSVKATVGHTESAAGILGLIKAVLCLRHRQIPKQPQFDELNPSIDLSGSRIAIPTSLRQWESEGMRASVSSYGMSGTNAYAVLSAPADTQAPQLTTPLGGFALSARTLGALQDLASRYSSHLAASNDDDFPAFAYTATHGRTRQQHTAWVGADDLYTARSALDALSQGAEHEQLRILEGVQPLPCSEVPCRRTVRSLPTYPWQHQKYAIRPMVGTAEQRPSFTAAP